MWLLSKLVKSAKAGEDTSELAGEVLDAVVTDTGAEGHGEDGEEGSRLPVICEDALVELVTAVRDMDTVSLDLVAWDLVQISASILEHCCRWQAGRQTQPPLDEKRRMWRLYKRAGNLLHLAARAHTKDMFMCLVQQAVLRAEDVLVWRELWLASVMTLLRQKPRFRRRAVLDLLESKINLLYSAIDDVSGQVPRSPEHCEAMAEPRAPAPAHSNGRGDRGQGKVMANTRRASQEPMGDVEEAGTAEMRQGKHNDSNISKGEKEKKGEEEEKEEKDEQIKGNLDSEPGSDQGGEEEEEGDASVWETKALPLVSQLFGIPNRGEERIRPSSHQLQLELYAHTLLHSLWLLGRHAACDFASVLEEDDRRPAELQTMAIAHAAVYVLRFCAVLPDATAAARLAGSVLELLDPTFLMRTLLPIPVDVEHQLRLEAFAAPTITWPTSGGEGLSYRAAEAVAEVEEITLAPPAFTPDALGAAVLFAAAHGCTGTRAPAVPSFAPRIIRCE